MIGAHAWHRRHSNVKWTRSDVHISERPRVCERLNRNKPSFICLFLLVPSKAGLLTSSS
jgi:hypothetical protein